MNADFEHKPYGFNGYQQHYAGMNGVMVSFTPGRADISVSIPGTACTQLGTLNLIGITDELEAMPTRVDFAYDHCNFTPKTFDRAWEKGNVNTRVRRSGDSYLYMKNGEGNETVYMGAASSESRLVCYNKRGYTRLEMRLKKERAAKFWAMVCAAPQDLGELGAGVIAAHVDFVKRSKTDSNVSRAPRLRWWAKFLKDAEKIRLSDPEPEPTVERAKKFVNNAAGMIETVFQIAEQRGVDEQTLLNTLRTRGKRLMRDRHRSILAMAPTHHRAPVKPELVQVQLFRI